MFREEQTESKPHTAKQLLIYGYLYMNRTMRDEVKLSLEELIIGCGYTPHKGKDRTNDQFRQELSDMYRNNYSGCFDLYTESDISTINTNERFVLNLSNILYDYDSFTKILFNDFDKIIHSDYKILLIYLYIKSYIFERKKDRDGTELESIQNKQEGYALSYEQISKGTNIAKSSVIKIIIALQDLQLIECYTTGGYKDQDGKIRNAPNIYVLYGKQKEIPYIINNLRKQYKVNDFFEIKQNNSS